MAHIKDGKYTVYSHYEGKDQILGHFIVKDDVISFENEHDHLNLDRFPEGKMSPSTINFIKKCLNSEHNHITIKHG